MARRSAGRWRSVFGPLGRILLATVLVGGSVAVAQVVVKLLQGVLSRESLPDGSAAYRLVAPERYAQINQDVVRHPPQAQRRRVRDEAGLARAGDARRP